MVLCLNFAGNQGGRQYAKNASSDESCLASRDHANLEHTTDVRCIKPDGGPSEEGSTTNVRSVVVFKAFLNDFENPFGVHEWEICSRRFPWVFYVYIKGRRSIDNPPRKQRRAENAVIT